MNWKELWSQTRATLTHNNFQSFCELGRSLGPTFKKLNVKIKDELKNPMSQFEVHSWKIREFTLNKAGHI